MAFSPCSARVVTRRGVMDGAHCSIEAIALRRIRRRSATHQGDNLGSARAAFARNTRDARGGTRFADGRSVERPMTMTMPMVRIKFKCASVDSFIEKYHSDVNPIGIFVRTRSPVRAGTAISFDLRLREDQPLFMGTGVVVWARQDDRMAPLLDAGMMLGFDRLNDDSRHTFDYVLSQKQALDEALDSVPTLVRRFGDGGGASSRPLPMTTKMSAEEMESLRIRMRQGMAADAGATAALVDEASPLCAVNEPQPQPEPQLQPQPQPQPQPDPPLYAEPDLEPQAASTVLAKVLVLKADGGGVSTPATATAAGVIEARLRTPMEITGNTQSPPASKHWVRLIGISIVSWLLVLVLFVFVRWDLVGRMLEWIHST